MFVLHGSQKVFGMFGGSGMDKFAKMLTGLGFTPGIFWAYLAGYSELICGALLILGLFTRLSAGILLIVILVAAITVHLKNGFFMMQGGFEYNFIIIAICVALILLGPGKISLGDKF
jgi:putative oxidoreductase